MKIVHESRKWRLLRNTIRNLWLWSLLQLHPRRKLARSVLSNFFPPRRRIARTRVHPLRVYSPERPFPSSNEWRNSIKRKRIVCKSSAYSNGMGNLRERLTFSVRSVGSYSDLIGRDVDRQTRFLRNVSVIFPRRSKSIEQIEIKSRDSGSFARVSPIPRTRIDTREYARKNLLFIVNKIRGKRFIS